MANTTSAKKALRQSKRRQEQNLFWRKRIKNLVKSIEEHLGEKSVDADIIKKEQQLLYKIVDKAASKNVIHKNKARRIKSRLSKEIAVHDKSSDNSKPKARKSKSPAKS